MSGASGSIPAAIHVTPESVHAGPIAKLRDGDVVRVDAVTGRLDVLVDEAEFASRLPAARVTEEGVGTGRELFGVMRSAVGRADEGAHVFGSLAAVPEPVVPHLPQEESR
jgi:phosphogluconate dehydratase